MDIKLSRRRHLSERQRRKQIVDPNKLDSTTPHEWPMKTRIRIFCPYFEWNGTLRVENESILGRGKFSTVVKCKVSTATGHSQTEAEEVAVKILDKSAVISQSMSKQICQERRIQSVCSAHPYILPLLRVWQDEHKLYLELPLCDRGQLFELWSTLRKRGDAFSVTSVCIAALQLASALNHIQNLGVIYRDLKLNNVLISKEGNLQVSDFGLSKWLGRHERTRTICGTLAYMAPEVLQGNPYGHAADWWSLGVLLHCLSAMKFPFARGKDHFEMLSIIFGTKRQEEGLPEDIDLLLKCLMTITESDRVTSYRQLELCFQSEICYDEMVSSGVSFLSTLGRSDSLKELSYDENKNPLSSVSALTISQPSGIATNPKTLQKRVSLETTL